MGSDVSSSINTHISAKLCSVQKKFTNVKDWNLHHRKHHPDANYTCEKCNKVSSTLIQHRDYIYNHKEMQFSCGRCCKSFPSISHHNLHRHLHKQQWLYSCFAADCKQEYKWPQDLLWHLKVHLPERYKCAKCSYSNPERRLSVQHSQIHTNELHYTCRKCNKQFKHSMQRY